MAKWGGDGMGLAKLCGTVDSRLTSHSIVVEPFAELIADDEGDLLGVLELLLLPLSISVGVGCRLDSSGS